MLNELVNIKQINDAREVETIFNENVLIKNILNCSDGDLLIQVYNIVTTPHDRKMLLYKTNCDLGEVVKKVSNVTVKQLNTQTDIVNFIRQNISVINVFKTTNSLLINTKNDSNKLTLYETKYSTTYLTKCGIIIKQSMIDTANIDDLMDDLDDTITTNDLHKLIKQAQREVIEYGEVVGGYEDVTLLNIDDYYYKVQFNSNSITAVKYKWAPYDQNAWENKIILATIDDYASYDLDKYTIDVASIVTDLDDYDSSKTVEELVYDKLTY